MRDYLGVRPARRARRVGISTSRTGRPVYAPRAAAAVGRSRRGARATAAIIRSLPVRARQLVTFARKSDSRATRRALPRIQGGRRHRPFNF